MKPGSGIESIFQLEIKTQRLCERRLGQEQSKGKVGSAWPAPGEVAATPTLSPRLGESSQGSLFQTKQWPNYSISPRGYLQTWTPQTEHF